MYYLYILECADQTLYTGITRDLERRVREHNFSHLGAKYTLVRRPVKVVFSKEFEGKSDALREEAHIKKLSHVAKLKLVEDYGKNPLSMAK